jgi:hypothetical protein
VQERKEGRGDLERDIHIHTKNNMWRKIKIKFFASV